MDVNLGAITTSDNRMLPHVILASDPGTKNFSSSVIRCGIVRKKFQYEIDSVEMLANTLTSFTGGVLPADVKLYRGEIKRLARAKPTYLIAERFMNRGPTGGVSGELVSMMLAYMERECTTHKSFDFITAAQWKNASNRFISLDELYQEAPFVPHAVDAIMIGLYAGSRLCQIKPFEFLAGSGYKALLKRMEKLNGAIRAKEGT